MKYTIKDILHGVEPGRIQTSGLMQVIPLLSDLEDDRFVSPNVTGAAKFSSTNYGTMTFENTTADKTLIIPAHASYVTKESAQDHGMTHAALMKYKSRRTYNTAACIQETQCGSTSHKQHEMIILPLPLREFAFSKRKDHNVGKLWDVIGRMNKGLGATGKGHLIY